MPATTAILDRMGRLADATRVRLLRLLEQHELTVAELCAVVQLPQSTVSRHLKVLADDAWLASRREGTRTLYRLTLDDLDPADRKLWLLVRSELAETSEASRDERRLQRVLDDRRTRSQAFFATAAGQWDRYRHELFGSVFHLGALPALLDPDWVVGDLGCGTGQVAAALAPFVRRVVAIDNTPAMLKAARQRFRRMKNVEVRKGELAALPLDDGELNAAVYSLVLHHLPDPEAALVEASRVLQRGGRLLLIDMQPHDRAEYKQTMGHQWLGFAPASIKQWLTTAGLTDGRYQTLPANPAAKGPGLFAATAIKK